MALGVKAVEWSVCCGRSRPGHSAKKHDEPLATCVLPYVCTEGRRLRGAAHLGHGAESLLLAACIRQRTSCLKRRSLWLVPAAAPTCRAVLRTGGALWRRTLTSPRGSPQHSVVVSGVRAAFAAPPSRSSCFRSTWCTGGARSSSGVSALRQQGAGGTC